MSDTNSCNVECSVFIPARTLEDFPTDLDDCNARSTLAAWTALWHPELLAASEQTPAWHRADSPPEPETHANPDSDGSFVGHLFIIPTPSLELLPDGYADRAKSAGAIWVTGPDRCAILDQLHQAGLIHSDLPSQSLGNRQIGAEDFFAAGFASLQIQIMTRRLRYTSNLDQIHLQTRLVDAAVAFVNQRTADAVEALHDVFDCLAEERDHYFTSDPHLIDLTLVAASTAERAMADSVTETATAADSTFEEEGILQVPVNVLIDADAITVIAQQNDSVKQRFCQRLRENEIGWAAGGPAANVHFDLLNYASAAQAIANAHQQATDCIGTSPPVYGRFDGDTPVDLIAAIAAQGYAGVIPLNFAAGTGHGSEAKVLLPISGNDGDEIEALTAKPIDAASDAAFLAIGSRLGEAIDGGEIATGLLVHWPGQGCDSFHDLRRLATWSLSLGRFWKISDYFSSGQRPYHRGNLSAIASDPASIDNILFSDDMADPITATGEALVQSALDRRDRVLTAISGLLNPSNNSGSTASNRTIDDSMKSIANSAGMTWDPDGDGKMVVNANSIPLRVAAEIRGTPAAMKHVYSCDRDQDRYLANLDVPALGYAIVRPAAAGEKSCASGSRSAGIGGWIRNQFLGRGPSIAEGVRLHNEFMEVEISDQFGGVAGVYSGGARGNRFSMRLVAETESSGSESTIRCDDVLVTKSTAAVGQIEAKGRLLVEGSEIATFVNRYSLASGSRMLTVHVELKKSKDLDMNDWQADRWKNYIAARVAVPEESSVCGALIRDKVHRSRGRRIVAPLGLVVDEGERQTLITSDGYPLHRRVGKRFYDTLLMVRGQSNHSFNLRYGFDVAQPVATAWSGLAAARQLAFRVNPGVNPQANSSGWFAHVGPREVLISDMQFHQLEPHQEFSSPQHVSGNEGVAEEYSDQTIGLEIELIATRGKSCTASLRFFRQPVSAYRLAGKPPFESNAGQPLELKNDAIRIPLNGHEACRIMVVFDDSHRKESK